MITGCVAKEARSVTITEMLASVSMPDTPSTGMSHQRPLVAFAVK